MFYAQGPVGAGSPHGSFVEFSAGKVVIPGTWFQTGQPCQHCGSPVETNGVDDAAFCRGECAKDGRIHPRCPRCGGDLVLHAEIENGQMICRCDNCGNYPLSLHKNVEVVQRKTAVAAA